MFLDCGDYTATIYQTGSFNIIITKGTIRSLHVWEIGSLGGEKWGFGGEGGGTLYCHGLPGCKNVFSASQILFL